MVAVDALILRAGGLPGRASTRSYRDFPTLGCSLARGFWGQPGLRQYGGKCFRMDVLQLSTRRDRGEFVIVLGAEIGGSSMIQLRAQWANKA